MPMNYEHKEIPFVRELCKGDSEEEIREAEDNFRRFLGVIKRMAERLHEEEAVDDS